VIHARAESVIGAPIVHPLIPVVVVKRKGACAERAFVVVELATFAEVIADA
jgi:hypothetical protein